LRTKTENKGVKFFVALEEATLQLPKTPRPNGTQASKPHVWDGS